MCSCRENNNNNKKNQLVRKGPQVSESPAYVRSGVPTLRRGKQSEARGGGEQADRDAARQKARQVTGAGTEQAAHQEISPETSVLESRAQGNGQSGRERV